MTGTSRWIVTLCALLTFAALGRQASAQATAVSVSGSYGQNFDSMPNSASAALPTGWSFFRSGTSSVQPNFSLSGSNATVVGVAAGSVGSVPTTGAAYQWVTGSAASGTDKAIGFLASTSYPGTSSSAAPGQSLAILFGFTNTTGGLITNLDLTWDYEKYRSGMRAMSWNFFSSTDGSTWTANSAGDQSYAADANSTTLFNPPTVSAKTVSLSGLNIANGSSYYLRWSYVTTGSWTNAQGLGFDNFTMSPTVSGGGGTDLYWSAGSWAATAPGSGGSGAWADGSGSWDSSKKANFSGTAGTVTVGTVTAANGLLFTTSGYTLAGGTISLAGSSSGLNTIATGTDGSVTTTVNSVLTGTAGLMKMGAGTLVLGGANTFSGGLTLSAGTLQIASDSNLGDAANALSLNGTLKTTGNVSLGSGRAISGGASLDIAPGTTLTVGGSYAAASTTLLNSGTLDLQGSTRSVGTLTFSTAASVVGSGGLTVAGITATGVTSGTASIVPSITFASSGDKTVDVGTGGTLSLGGDVAGTTGRIVKTGAGTLVVSGSNSTSGYRLGAAGATPTNGGTLILGSAAASGTGQLQLNYGTLQATSPFTFTKGLSVGGRAGAVAVLGGPNSMTFSGSTSFFRGNGTSGELRLDVNNATTLSGVIGPTSGSGTATGITIGGTGSLTISGNASAMSDLITIQDLLGFTVNGTLFTGTAGSLTAQVGTLLGGSGTIAGAVTMANGSTLAPGNSAGTLTIAGALGLNSATNLVFELSATDQTVGGGINDLVTGITNLTLDGVLNVTGIGDFSSVAAGAKWRLFGYSGTLIDQGLTLGSMPTLASGNSFAIDLDTTGQVSLMVVPEPAAFGLACSGVALAAFAAWKRRRRA